MQDQSDEKRRTSGAVRRQAWRALLRCNVAGLLGGLTLVASCSSDGVERTGRLQQRAAVRGVRVSEPLTLLSGSIGSAAGEFRQLACSGAHCAVFYVQEGRVLASRVSAQGALLDDPRIVLGQTRYGISVAAHASEYVLAWTDANERMVRLDPADLQPIAELSESVSEKAGILLSDGSSLASLESTSVPFEPRELALIDGAKWRVTTEHLVSEDTTLVAGSGQYLVVEDDYAGSGPTARRLDGRSGEFLDPPKPLFPSGFLDEFDSVSGIQGVHAAGFYQLALTVWLDDAATPSVYGVRVEGATGQLVPPTGSADTAPIKLCDACGSLEGMPFRLSSQAEGWVFDTATGAFEVDVLSGRRAQDGPGADTASLPALALAPAGAPRLALLPGGVATVDAPDIEHVTFGPATAEAKLGHELRVEPSVHAQGSSFLVTWSARDRLFRGMLLGRGVDGTPEPLGPTLALGDGSTGSIWSTAALPGRGFMVVEGVQRSAGRAGWRGYVLGLDLTLQATWQESFPAESGDFVFPRVTASGTGYLVSAYLGPLPNRLRAGDLQLQLRAADGSALGPIQVLTKSFNLPALPCIDTTAAPDQQTFLVFSNPAEPPNEQLAWPISASAGSVGASFTLPAGACVPVGGKALLLGQDAPRLFDFQTRETQQLTIEGGAPLNRPKWDGKTLVASSWDESGIFAHRYALEPARLGRLDSPDGIRITSDPSLRRAMDASEVGALFVYETAKPPEFLHELNAVLLEHDGLPDPTLGEGGHGGQSSHAGAGGEIVGSAGEAGNGAGAVADAGHAGVGDGSGTAGASGSSAGSSSGGDGGAEPPHVSRTAKGCGCDFGQRTSSWHSPLALLSLGLVARSRKRRAARRRAFEERQ